MKMERIVIIVFTALGIIAGAISSYLDPIFALVVSLAIFFLEVVPMLKLFNDKRRRKWFIQNSVITFFLIWIVVWILLYTR